MSEDGRFIVLWRKTGEDVLDWDFHTCESRNEADTAVSDLKCQGVHQYSTYRLGDQINELSSKY